MLAACPQYGDKLLRKDRYDFMKIKKKNYTTVDGLLGHLTKDELAAVLNKT